MEVEVGAPVAGGGGAGGFAEEEAEVFGGVLLREAAGARGFDAVGAAVDEEGDGGKVQRLKLKAQRWCGWQGNGAGLGGGGSVAMELFV